MVRASGLLFVLLALPGLGSAATFRAHLRRPRHGLQVRLSPITVAPRSEREVCQLVTLRNRRPMDVSEITMAMPSGATYASHHFAIFLYRANTRRASRWGRSTASAPAHLRGHQQRRDVLHGGLLLPGRRHGAAAARGGLLRGRRRARLPVQSLSSRAKDQRGVVARARRLRRSPGSFALGAQQAIAIGLRPGVACC